MSLLDRCKSLFDKVSHGASVQPTWVPIPASRVDEPARLGAALARDRQYFQVRVNEMYLANSREWWVEYDPMVFASTEFIYDKAEIAVPFIVGPSMLQKLGQKVPDGMVLANTRVAGVHPYRGGRIAFTMILYQVQRQNWSRGLLSVIESTANAIDFSTAVSSYTKVAVAILDGVEALLGLGGTVPVVGYRVEFDPQAGDDLSPRYFALIDRPAGQVDAGTLRVVGGKLHDANGPFRGADFVLYSLVSTAERTDETTLPFYPQWERVQQEATNATEDGYKSAKANMVTLYQSLLLSADLTDPHAEALADEYVKLMKMRHDKAVGMATLAGAGAQPAAARGPTTAAMPAKARNRSLDVLDL